MSTSREKNFRIRAVARQNSRMLLVAAVMLALSGVANRVAPRLLDGPPSQLSLLCIAAFIAAGALLFLCRERANLFWAACMVTLVAVHLFYAGGAPRDILLTDLAALLVFLSAIGFRFNVVVKFLPGRLALPVMNLLSMALILLWLPITSRASDFFFLLSGMSPLKSYALLLIRLLPVVSVLLISLAVEPQRAAAGGRPDMCTRSVPKGGALFAIASWLLLAVSAFHMLKTVYSIYSVNALLLTIPPVAAGILLVLYKGREKRFLAAAICLLLSVALSFFNGTYLSAGFWTYSVPILLMFLSAIGALWNTVPARLSKITRAPILNILAAVLLLVNIVVNTMGTMEHNALVADTKEAAILEIASAARGDVFTAVFGRERAEEATANLEAAVADFEAALEKAGTLISERNATAYTDEVNAVVAEVDELKAAAERPAAELDEAVLAFAATLTGVSKDAGAAFEIAVARMGGDAAESSDPPDSELTAPAEAAPESNPTSRGLVDAAGRARTAALEAGRTAVFSVGYAADGTENALAALRQAEEAIEAAVETAEKNKVQWYTLTLNLLPVAALILLNLSLGSREVQQRGALAAFMQLCRRIVRWFYRDVGGKLQVLAKIQGVVCMVLACLSALTAAVGLCGFLVNYVFVGAGEQYLMLLACGLAGIIASFVLALPTWLMYAFGQITADLREVREQGGMGGASASGEENPDDLPEL